MESAEADLFRNRTYILTEGTAPPRPNQKSFVELLSLFGCRIVTLSPAEHDRIVSYYSHVPQLASTALAAMISRTDSTKQAAGPGLMDMTRLAMSSYAVWRDIIATNHSVIGPALDHYISVLQEVRDSLGTAEMEKLFDSGAALAKSIRRDF